MWITDAVNHCRRFVPDLPVAYHLARPVRHVGRGVRHVVRAVAAAPESAAVPVCAVAPGALDRLRQALGKSDTGAAAAPGVVGTPAGSSAGGLSYGQPGGFSPGLGYSALPGGGGSSFGGGSDYAAIQLPVVGGVSGGDTGTGITGGGDTGNVIVGGGGASGGGAGGGDTGGGGTGVIHGPTYGDVPPVVAVPEPGSLAVLGIGLVIVIAARKVAYRR